MFRISFSWLNFIFRSVGRLELLSWVSTFLEGFSVFRCICCWSCTTLTVANILWINSQLRSQKNEISCRFCRQISQKFGSCDIFEKFPKEISKWEILKIHCEIYMWEYRNIVTRSLQDLIERLFIIDLKLRSSKTSG